MNLNKLKYINQYNKENYGKIRIWVYKGNRSIIKKKADEIGTTVPKLILKALEKQYDIKFSE